jgi:hypothetical protein
LATQTSTIQANPLLLRQQRMYLMSRGTHWGSSAYWPSTRRQAD